MISGGRWTFMQYSFLWFLNILPFSKSCLQCLLFILFSPKAIKIFQLTISVVHISTIWTLFNNVNNLHQHLDLWLAVFLYANMSSNARKSTGKTLSQTASPGLHPLALRVKQATNWFFRVGQVIRPYKGEDACDEQFWLVSSSQHSIHS